MLIKIIWGSDFEKTVSPIDPAIRNSATSKLRLNSRRNDSALEEGLTVEKETNSVDLSFRCDSSEL